MKINWKTARVYEKIDGSLMTLYFYDNKWIISSSGKPDADGNGADVGHALGEQREPAGEPLLANHVRCRTCAARKAADEKRTRIITRDPRPSWAGRAVRKAVVCPAPHPSPARRRGR